MTRPVQLHIDEIVIHGYAGVDPVALRQQLVAALSLELAGLEPGDARHHLRASEIGPRPTSGRPEPQLARSIAQTIARTIGPSKRSKA